MIVKENGTEFTRKELYDLLTEKPMNKVAHEYQLDLNSLIKCIAQYNIPRRSSGDWTKISMGRSVDREPLTGNPDETFFVARFQPKPKAEKKPAKKTEHPPFLPESHSAGSSHPIQGPAWTDARKKPWTPRSLNSAAAGDQKEEKLDYASPVTTSTGYTSRKRLKAFDHDKSLYEVLEIAPTDEYQKVNVFELPFTVRSINGLMRANLDTLHKLMSQSLSYLLEIRNLGFMSVESILVGCKTYCLQHPEKKEEPTETHTECPAADPIPATAQATASSGNNSLLIKLMMEFYKLNTVGQEVAVELIKALTNIHRFKAQHHGRI